MGELPSQEPRTPPNPDIHIRRYIRLSDSNHIDICKPVHRYHTAYEEFVKFVKKKGKASSNAIASYRELDPLFYCLDMDLHLMAPKNLHVLFLLQLLPSF